MTDINIPDDDIRDLIRELARKQNTTQDQILATQEQLYSLTNDVTRILASNALNDNVLIELRENQETLQRNFETHQQNFNEHQRTSNALLESLKAILVQLTSIDRNGN